MRIQRTYDAGVPVLSASSRPWTAYIPQGAGLIRSLTTGLDKGWKYCTPLEFIRHLIYVELKPQIMKRDGIPSFDIEAAVVREINLNAFVEAIHTLLEFSEPLLDFYRNKGGALPTIVEYRILLVKTLKYIERIQDEEGIKIATPIDWNRVARFVPDWASIPVDPEKDSREQSPSPLSQGRSLRRLKKLKGAVAGYGDHVVRSSVAWLLKGLI